MSHRDRDRGFTLVEVMVTVALLGVIMVIGVSGWSSWSAATAHRSTAQELAAALRQAQQRAVTDGRELRVRFDLAEDTYTVWQAVPQADGTEVEVRLSGPVPTASEEIELAEPSFDDGAQTHIVFNARGDASPGTVRVTRDGAAPYVVRVEELTGRASIE